MASPDLFEKKIVPVMNKVRDDLCAKRADELRDRSFSLASLGSMAADPYGMDNSYDTLRVVGKWNSKTVEDYVTMVKQELKKQGITVTKDIEQKMIDKMVKDKIPKGSIDYVIQKAAKSSLFYIPTAARTSPLETHIEEQAEKAYNPKLWEKGAGWALGTAADIATTGGFGASWRTMGKVALTDVALTGAADTFIPSIVAPGKEKEYLAMQEQIKKEQKTPEAKPKEEIQEETTEEAHEEETPSQQNEESLGSTWDELVSTLGFKGITDIGNNLGYILAMLPDMLVGLFTGKTKSINLHDDMLPLASLVGGMFVKNPLLKTMMMGYGGANLLNKAGHEALERHNAPIIDATRGYGISETGTKYKVYQDEALNPRVQRPMISGNRLICNIDGVPCNIQLNDNIVGAYQTGCLPLNTLVNAILARNDKVQQVATTNYEESQQQTQTRSRGV